MFMRFLLIFRLLIFLLRVFLVDVVSPVVMHGTILGFVLLRVGVVIFIILVLVLFRVLTLTTQECDGCPDCLGGHTSHAHGSLRFDCNAKGLVNVGIIT